MIIDSSIRVNSVTKTGARITVDVDEWERFKQKYNASEKIREYIKEVNGSSGQLQDRIEKLNDDIQEKKNEINKLQRDISDLQNKRRTLENELERQNQTEPEEERFLRICNRKMDSRDWTGPSDIKSYWVQELDKDREELWEWAQEAEIEVESN